MSCPPPCRPHSPSPLQLDTREQFGKREHLLDRATLSHIGSWSSWFHCIADRQCPTQRTSGGQREGGTACRTGEKVALLQQILFLYASESTRRFLGYFPREGENKLPVAPGEKGKCWVGFQLSWEWKNPKKHGGPEASGGGAAWRTGRSL